MTALNARGFPVPKPWRPRVPDYRPAPLSDPGKPGRFPANDPARHPFRDPFRGVPDRVKPGLLRRLPGGRLLRSPLWWLMLPDLIDPANWMPGSRGAPPFFPSGKWYRTHGPYEWYTYGIVQPLNQPRPQMSRLNWPGRISGQAVTPPEHTEALPGTTAIGFWWEYKNPSNGIIRNANYERWQRDVLGREYADFSFPGINPRSPFPAEPGVVPVQGYPETYPYPGALPGPVPLAVPPQLQPYAPPKEWPDQAGYAPPVGVPSPFLPGLPSPPVNNPPGQKPTIPPAPGYVLSQEWSFGPANATGRSTSTAPRQQLRRRRDRNRNDPKYRSKIIGRIWRVIGSVTEAGDMIDIAFASLPKSIRQMYGKKPTPYEKARAVYRHWEVMDMNEFVHKLIANQIEDAIFGLWGRFGAKASKILGDITGRPVGINQGSSAKRLIDYSVQTKLDYQAYQQFNAGRRARGKRPVTFRYWSARYKEDVATPLDVFFEKLDQATRTVYNKPYNARAAEIDLRTLT